MRDKPQKPHPLDQLIIVEKDARDFGFYWPDHNLFIDQVKNECDEVRQAIIDQEPRDRLQEEVSDILHAAIALCNHLNFNINETIEIAEKKFARRMTALKALCIEKGITHLHDKQKEEKLALWREVKKSEKS